MKRAHNAQISAQSLQALMQLMKLLSPISMQAFLQISQYSKQAKQALIHSSLFFMVFQISVPEKRLANQLVWINLVGHQAITKKGTGIIVHPNNPAR